MTADLTRGCIDRDGFVTRRGHVLVDGTARAMPAGATFRLVAGHSWGDEETVRRLVDALPHGTPVVLDCTSAERAHSWLGVCARYGLEVGP